MKILLTATIMIFTLTSFADVLDSKIGAFYDSWNNTIVLDSWHSSDAAFVDLAMGSLKNSYSAERFGVRLTTVDRGINCTFGYLRADGEIKVGSNVDFCVINFNEIMKTYEKLDSVKRVLTKKQLRKLKEEGVELH